MQIHIFLKNRGIFTYIDGHNYFRYRESINPLFYLYFSDIKRFSLAYEPIYRIPSNSYTPGRPLEDLIGGGVIDYIEFYKRDKGFITIMATAYSKYKNNNYTLWLDGNLIHISYYRNISYFSRDYI